MTAVSVSTTPAAVEPHARPGGVTDRSAVNVVSLSPRRELRLRRRAVAGRWSALPAPSKHPDAARLGRTSTHSRLAKCGRAPVGGGPVSLTVGASGSAYYAGVQHCGSVWVCPVCSATICHHRAQELERGLRQLRVTRPDAQVLLLTLTIRHGRSDALSDTLDATMAAWSRGVIAGKGWSQAKARFSILGWARTLEVTLGPSGWHPHLHAMVITKSALSHAELAELRGDIYRRWAGALGRYGLPLPSLERGVRLDPVDPETSGVGAYLTKTPAEHSEEHRVATEVMRGDLKGSWGTTSLTPFELLDLAGSPREPWARHRWAEYEEATWNRRRLTWSRGCRELLGLVEPELSDEEIVEAPDPERTTLAVLSPVQWATLRRHQDGAALVRLLALVEGGHHVQARWWLEGIVGPVLLPGSWAEGGP